MSRALVAVLAIAIAAVAACAPRVANLCPDSKDTHCLTNVVCSMDNARGCQVCRCEAPYEVPPQQPPQGMPQSVPQ